MSVIKVFLRQTSQRCDFVYSQLVLVLLEDIEQVFIENTLSQRLQNLQMGVVSIAESCVDEGLIVDSSHLIEEIICNFGTFHRLFARIVEFLIGQQDCLVEIEYAEVVETAKNIEVYIVFHEFELRVERIVPYDLHVIYHLSVIFVPIQPLGHDDGKANVHFYGGNELIGLFKGGLIVGQTCHLISQLSDLGYGLPESEGLLSGLHCFEIFADGLYEVSWF